MAPALTVWASPPKRFEADCKKTLSEHPLSGRLAGFHAIRINDHWRIVFKEGGIRCRGGEGKSMAIKRSSWTHKRTFTGL